MNIIIAKVVLVQPFEIFIMNPEMVGTLSFFGGVEFLRVPRSKFRRMPCLHI